MSNSLPVGSVSARHPASRVAPARVGPVVAVVALSVGPLDDAHSSQSILPVVGPQRFHPQRSELLVRVGRESHGPPGFVISFQSRLACL